MKPCCQDPKNLLATPSGRTDLAIVVCQQCGCRHFEAIADPGRFGIVLKGL